MCDFVHVDISKSEKFSKIFRSRYFINKWSRSVDRKQRDLISNSSTHAHRKPVILIHVPKTLRSSESSPGPNDRTLLLPNPVEPGRVPDLTPESFHWLRTHAQVHTPVHSCIYIVLTYNTHTHTFSTVNTTSYG